MLKKSYTTGTDRRTFLHMAGIGALTAAGAGALSGCGSRAVMEASGAGSVTLPAFAPAEGLSPSLSGTDQGAPPGFFNYPKSPAASVPEPPLDGQKFTAITNIFGPPPRERSSNPAWQEVEKRLGAKVDITAVSASDYSTKFNTAVASDDLPDLMLNNGASIPNIVGFLEAECQDLTSFLSGEAVNDYPNLAAIPGIFWKQTVHAGKIYELPIPRSMTGGSGFYNHTLFSEAGVDDTSMIAGAEDYLSLLKDLTNPSDDRWALGSTNYGLPPLYHIFNVPNFWSLEGGELTYYFETDEYLEAIGFAEKAMKAGVFYPGSVGWTKSQMVNAFISGRVAQIYDGLPAFQGPTGYAKSLPQANPDRKALPFIPFGHDGGKAGPWLDNIVFATVMVKRGEDARVRDTLKLANFLAAPFGSQEYLLLNYGAEGVDYHPDDHGNPVPTERAPLDTAVPWKYLAAPRQVVYDPTSKQTVSELHEAYAKLIPMGIENPCGTLFSPTEARKGSALDQSVSDAANDFIAGRGTLDELKSAVKTWRTDGGDTIREEYEKVLAGSDQS